ncbi:hypothetical protein CEXT_427861, partial [Caerostris extrusa]
VKKGKVRDPLVASTVAPHSKNEGWLYVAIVTCRIRGLYSGYSFTVLFAEDPRFQISSGFLSLKGSIFTVYIPLEVFVFADGGKKWDFYNYIFYCSVLNCPNEGQFHELSALPSIILGTPCDPDIFENQCPHLSDRCRWSDRGDML